jgi:hypothetical protein
MLRALVVGACCLLASHAALCGCKTAAVGKSGTGASASAPGTASKPLLARPGLRAEAESDPLTAALYLALREQDPRSLTLVAERIAQRGQRSRAVEALDEAQARCGRPSTFKRELGGENVKAYDLSHIAAVRARLGDVAEALKLADSIKRGLDSPYGALAKADAQQAIAVKLAEMGDFDASLKLAKSIQACRRMWAGGRLEECVQDDTSKLGALVDISISLAKAEKMDVARQTIDAIDSPSEQGRALAAVALVLDQRGQRAQAERLLGEAASRAKEDAALLVNLAEGYRRIGKTAAGAPLLDRAVRLAGSSATETGGASLRMRVAEECFAAGRTKQATEMLDRTFSAVKVTEFEAVREQLYLLKEMARISARGGRFERAREMAQAIGDEDYGDEARLEVVKAYAEAGQVESAAELARAITFPDHRAAALSVAAGAYLTVGKRAEASAVLTLAMAAVPKSLNSVYQLLEIEMQYHAGGLVPDAAAKLALRELLRFFHQPASAPSR